VLLGEDPGARETLHEQLSALAGGATAGADVLDAVRRSLVAALRVGDRVDLVHDLDRELLGIPRRGERLAHAV
jgi:hypothetical protein